MSRLTRLGSVVLVVAVVVVSALVGSGNREVTIRNLAVGDCFMLAGDEIENGALSFELIDCDDALDSAASGLGTAAFVLEVGQLAESGAAYPMEKELLALVDERCDPFLDVAPSVLPLLPDSEAWEVAAGPYACLSVSLG
jgi:hypothetical protein